MIYTPKAAVAEAQMRVLEILADAGWIEKEAWFRHIPAVRRVVVMVAAGAIGYEGKPDDDFRVLTESGGVCDPRRNVGDYGADFQWVVTKAKVGDAVLVDVTNFWSVSDPNSMLSVRWQAWVEFEKGGRRSYCGGVEADLGTQKNGAVVANGGFVIEPPVPYRLPYWLKNKDFRFFLSRGGRGMH